MVVIIKEVLQFNHEQCCTPLQAGEHLFYYTDTLGNLAICSLRTQQTKHATVFSTKAATVTSELFLGANSKPFKVFGISNSHCPYRNNTDTPRQTEKHFWYAFPFVAACLCVTGQHRHHFIAKQSPNTINLLLFDAKLSCQFCYFKTQ